MFDIIVRGGRVIDGSGAPWFPADVAITGERIAAVGRLDGALAGQEIDATGLIVAPGFVDVHEHSDFTLLADPRAASAIHQGVTTVVPGNCGFGAAPIAPSGAPRAGLFGYVAGLDLTWRSFGEYLDCLRQAHTAVNVAPLVGHGAIRSSVMGLADRAPRADEQKAMEQHLQESLEAGAFGLSIGLEYAPGQSAQPAEITPLARIVAGTGRLLAAHIRSRDFGYLPAVDEVLAIVRESGVSCQFSHLTARFGALRDADQRVWEVIERNRDEGRDITCDQHPFSFSNAGATSILPPWALEGGPETLRERLADPAARERCKAYRTPQNKLIVAGMWDVISIVAAPQSPDLLGRPLDQVAEERGGDPYDVIFDAMLAEVAAGGTPSSVRLRAEQYVDETVLRDALSHPLYMFESDSQVLAADGPLAAQRNPYSFGWVARLLGPYSRDRGWFRLEEAVRKLTSFPARRLGLVDRGLLLPGMQADLAIFDAATVNPMETPLDPSRYPSGFHHVLVNGVPSLSSGRLTGARAGKVLAPA
jgi:N-acyl-D-amino-acid deacylase